MIKKLDQYSFKNIKLEKLIFFNSIESRKDATKKEIELAFEVIKLKKEKYICEITSISNKYFLDKLIQLNENKYHVISIDVKNFKEVNDKYGQDFGDEILYAIMKHFVGITNSLKNKSYAIRNGGDEFILLLNEKYNKNEIGNILKKINFIIKKQFKTHNGSYIKVKFAFGKKYHEPNLTLKESVKEANIELTLNKSSKSRETRFLNFIKENYSQIEIVKLVHKILNTKN